MSERAQASRSGRLYVIATPIGNLEDITIRALKVLNHVDLIACEDTRRTARLLAAHQIRKPMVSYFEHNEERRTGGLVERLKAGESIALVSDAGTPTISDPGYRLVNAALAAGIAVIAIPGACTVAAALSIAGLPTSRFAFEGFLPTRRSARDGFLQALRNEPRTMVFFESAQRLAETLDAMSSSFGEDRPAALVRELTKVFEETIRGTVAELADRFRNARTKGEITLIIEGKEKAAAGEPQLTVEMLAEAGLGVRQASEVIAKLTGRSRRDIYQETIRGRRSHN